MPHDSVVSTLRYPHSEALNTFLFEIKYRCVPDLDQVTLIGAQLRRVKLFMLSDEALATQPAWMEVEYDEDSQPSIESGQWFLNALAGGCGEWEDIASLIHRNIMRESKETIEHRSEEHRNRLQSMRSAQ